MGGRYTVQEDEVPGIPLTRRVVVPLITEAIGARNAVMYTGIYEAGKRMPSHAHETAEELILVLSGEGEVNVDGKTEPLHPGTAIYLPPGSRHFLTIFGQEPMRIVFVFSPPVLPGSGPETPS